MQILKLALPSDSDWLSLGTGLQLLFLSFCRDRLSQIANKLYVIIMVTLTAWSDKKQRRDSTVMTIAVNLLLFPIVLGVVVIAAAMAAPLLPLFTLPVFLFGYPRPQRSWPEPVGSSANICPDTVYYRQFSPQLATALRKAYSMGTMGEMATILKFKIKCESHK